MSAALVSVVIPTRHRPALVCNAVRSVLKQTHGNLEIIVVIDGPDPSTLESLQNVGSNLRIIVNPKNFGLAETRNVGVEHSTGDWVAFLDDDDEWFPHKIEIQLAFAEQLKNDLVIVGSRYVEKTATLERVVPRFLPASAENLSDYIYCKRGFIQPSTIFTSRRLLLAVPFAKCVAIEDTDWLLRAVQDAGAKVVLIPDPLSVFNNASSGNRLGGAGPWEPVLAWGINNRGRFTNRSFPMFVIMECVARSRLRKESMLASLYLLSSAWMFSSLSVESICYFLAYLLLPAEQRRKIRSISLRKDRLDGPKVPSLVHDRTQIGV